MAKKMFVELLPDNVQRDIIEYAWPGLPIWDITDCPPITLHLPRIGCIVIFSSLIAALHRKINGGAGLVFEVSCVFDGFEIRITLVLT